MQLFSSLLTAAASVFVMVSGLEHHEHAGVKSVPLKNRASRRSKTPGPIGGDSSVWTPKQSCLSPSSSLTCKDSQFGNEHPNTDSCGIRSNLFELANLIDLSKTFNKQLNNVKQLNQHLISENQQLTAQNQQLTTQNQQLTTQNQQLTFQNQQLTTVNQQLTTQNQALTIQLAMSEANLLYINNNVLSLPLTFQSTTLSYSFNEFEGAPTQVVSNPNQSGINVSTRVAEVLKINGAQVFAGSSLLLGYPIDFSTKKIIKMKVYSPKVGAIVKIKLENNGPAIERDNTTTIMNTWEELSFDFSAINSANKYQSIVFFFDFGVVGDGTKYYFDDVIQTLS